MAHRQTLKLEIANIEFSSTMLRRKFDFVHSLPRILGLVAPLAGMLLLRRKRRQKKEESSFLSKLLFGFRLVRQYMPLLSQLQLARRHGIEARTLPGFMRPAKGTL